MRPTIVGLAVAIGGDALLVSPASRVLGDPTRLSTKLSEQLALWLLFGAVLAIVLFWERLPLSSIGVQPFGWRTLVRAASLAAVVMWLVTPIAVWVVAKANLPSIDAGIAEFGRLPLWFKLLAVVTAGVVEETLFRGYALERIATLSGSYAFAGVVTLAIFTLLHCPLWGAGGVLLFVFTGGAGTLFYLWQHDLVANVIAHIVVDAMGLLVVPARTRWSAGSSRGCRIRGALRDTPAPQRDRGEAERESVDLGSGKE